MLVRLHLLRDQRHWKNSRNSGEHALENAEQDIRDMSTSYGRGSQHIPQPNVLQVTNVFSSRVGEGERVTPEEPLE